MNLAGREIIRQSLLLIKTYFLDILDELLSIFRRLSPDDNQKDEIYEQGIKYLVMCAQSIRRRLKFINLAAASGDYGTFPVCSTLTRRSFRPLHHKSSPQKDFLVP
jgi:hypothetical protein